MIDQRSTAFPDAEILELQGSFQEVVSKGLAIECARRTFHQGSSDFQAVTYNRLCLALGADDCNPIAPRFRSIAESRSASVLADGTLLESAFLIAGAQEKPLRWKFRLPSPPKHYLDYYFMKASLDYGDIRSLQNIDHRVHTPKNVAFDSQLVLELTVAADGTARPKFIYRQAGPDSAAIGVEGQPFFLDMTYGEATTVGEAYVGIDFGTSNSSVSYIEQGAVKVYTERASDAGWRELNDLVSMLPYTASNPLVKFISCSTDQDVQQQFSATFENMLFSILTVAYAGYRLAPDAKKSSIFRQFTKGSAGPMWAVLRALLEKNPKQALFLAKLVSLLDARNKTAIDEAIAAINARKHHQPSTYGNYRHVLSILGNALSSALQGWRFGHFENVIKKGFSSRYTGLFISAHCGHPPFIDIFGYEGPESFSQVEAVLVCPEESIALRLSPLMYWSFSEGRSEQTVAVLDSISAQSSGYRLISGSSAVSVNSSSELADLHSMCVELTHSDASEAGVACAGIQLVAR